MVRPECTPVGEDVVEAGAHQPKRNGPHRDRVGQIGINAAAAKLALRDPPGQQHAAGQQDAVPSRLKRPEPKQIRVWTGLGSRAASWGCLRIAR